MIRERQIQSTAYSSGATVLVDLPRDAVYHWLTLSISAGSWVSVQGGSGTGPVLESSFPFSLIRSLRLIRNGSDVVWAGSGAQLAKEHYYMNRTAPFARLYTVASNVETLLTVTSRGITVPANADGINQGAGGFKLADAASSSTTMLFDMQMDLWLQIGVDDGYVATLLDARPLATFQMEIQWSTSAQVAIPGTANTSDTITATLNILSIDQDNMDASNFGTFKRSPQQYSNIPFNSSNFQVLLPRGNYFHGIIFQTRAYKSASTSIPSQENACLSSVENRINTNFQLRKFTLQQLQGKNMGDYGGHSQPYGQAGGMPEGWGFLYYPVARQNMDELVPTYVMDTFDLLISTQAIGSAQHGVTTAATNPIIDLLLQEVIPGVSVSKNAPQGASAGSIRRTSSKSFGM